MSFRSIRSRWFVLLLIAGVGTLVGGEIARAGASSDIACVSPPAGLVAWWPGDGDATDWKNSHHGVSVGGVGFTNGLVGQAFSLDGVDDYVDLGSWSPGAKWTVGAWVLCRSKVGDRRTILGGMNDCADWAIGLIEGEFVTNVRQPGGCTLGVATGVSPVLGEWYHLVGSCDGTNARVYVNGEFVRMQAVEANYTGTPAGVRLGNEYCCGGRFFNGLVDEPFVAERAFEADEIRALYAAGAQGMCKAGPCVPLPSGVVAWWRGQGNATDLVGEHNGILLNDAGFANGFVGQGFALDGVNDCITVPDSAALRPTNLTVAAWVNFSASTGVRVLLGKTLGTNALNSFVLWQSDGVLRATVCDESGAHSRLTHPFAPVPGSWYHLAYTVDSGTMTHALYVNGALAASDALVRGMSYDSNPLVIGAEIDNGTFGSFFAGRVDELVLFNRALSTNEIAGVFSADRGGLCPRMSFEPTTDFNITDGNPNSVWSYGWMPTDMSVFTLHPYGELRSSMPAWSRVSGGEPIIWKNTSGSAQYGVPPGWLSLHPGGGGEPSVLRWTAPVAGSASVAGNFLAGDSGTMQVAVRTNGQSWWHASNAGTFDLAGGVVPGDTVDFVVYGGYGFGNTPLQVTITVDLDDSVTPAITTQPTNQVVVAVRDVTFQVSAVGAAPLAYQWFFNGTPLSGATNGVLTIASATTNHAGSYHVVVANAFGSVTSEKAELIVPPDLSLTRVSSPASVLAGQPVSIAWTLTNLGPNVLTSPATIRLALSSAADGGNPSLLGEFRVTNTLAAGAAFTETNTVIFPMSEMRACWLVLTVDVNGEVFEVNETNNTWISTAPTAVLAADLVASRLTAPAAAEFGNTVNVAWAVTNRGSSTALASWSDRAYLSRASNSLSGATLLAEAAAELSPLDPNGGYLRSQSVTLPFSTDLVAGTFWIVVSTDYAGAQPEANEGNNLLSVPITLALPPLPDLAIVGVTAPSNVVANQPFTVAWAVTNLGSAAAIGAWSESIVASNSVSGQAWRAMFTFTNSLGIGQSLLRTQAVTLPLNGPAGNLVLLVEVDSRKDVLESVESNNHRSAANFLAVPLALSLQLSAAEGTEGATAIEATVTRNGAAGSGALTVTVTNSDPSELSTPATVIIPPEAPTASFTFTALNDRILDGPQTVTIGVTGAGYQSSQCTFTVLDADEPQLSITLLTNKVREGLSVMATVKRDLVTSDLLVVTVINPSSTRLTMPASVVIPAHSNSVAFPISALDDTLIEASTAYSVTVSAAAHGGAEAILTVLDDDTPQVALTLSAYAAGEGAGPQAVVGTLTRTAVSSRAVVVEIYSTNTGAATVPAKVTIPANVASITFPIAAVDDAALDGPQTTLIGGGVLATGLSTRVGDITPVLLTITDDEGPSLGLQFSSGLVKEGLAEAARMTVSRNTPATNSLTVNLTSSDTTEATVPASVTIPLGQSSVVVPMSSVADTSKDGNQTVVVTATAAGFAPASQTIVVSDMDLPDLVVTAVGAPEVAETEGQVNVSYRVMNQGFVSSTGAFLTRLFTSTNNTWDGGDTLVGQYRFTGALPAGQSFEQSLAVRLPQEAGRYWIIAQTDAEGVMDETIEDNNTRILQAPMEVKAAYGAWVRTDTEVAPAGTAVPMTGRATNLLGGGVAFKLVNVHVRVRGTERVISAITDAGGSYSVVFQPLASEAGEYEIFATHPGVATGKAQDSFSLLGIGANPQAVSVKVLEASSVSGNITLQNLSDQALTGLSVSVASQPEGVTVKPALSTNFLAGLAEASLSYAVEASGATGGGLVLLEVTSTQGAKASVSISVAVQALRPQLVAAPSELAAGMLRGRQAFVEFKVVNTGGLATGPILVSLPSVEWLQLATTNVLPSLSPGETNSVTILLTPSAELALGAYYGNLALSCTGANLAVPFNFRALSESNGALIVEAEDEYTYFAEGTPRVSGANVTVRDSVSHLVVTNGVTGANGQFFVPQLAEGYYDVEVAADSHDSYAATLLLLAGETNSVQAFLRRQTVKYVWSVVPTEIEDRTKIVLETVFETYVPAPVVTVEPGSIDLGEISGDSAQINLKISNHGLIAAQDVQLNLPTHPGWRFTPLVTDVGTVPGMSSLTVPMTIERLSSDTVGKKSEKSWLADCTATGSACYRYWCSKWIQVCMPVALLNARRDCGSSSEFRPPSIPARGDGFEPGGSSGGEGIPVIYGGGPPQYVVPPETCNECVNYFVQVNTTKERQCTPEEIAEYWAAFATVFNMVCLDGATPGNSPYINDEVYNALKADCPPNGTSTPPPLKCFELDCPGWWNKGSKSRLNKLPTESYVGRVPAVFARQYPLALNVAERLDRVMTKFTLLRTVFGDEAWLEYMDGTNSVAWLTNFVGFLSPQSEAGRRISAGEQERLILLPLPEGLTGDHVLGLISRQNRTADYNAAGIYEVAQVPAGQSTDFITRSAWSNSVVAVNRAAQASVAEGFSNVLESVDSAYKELLAQLTGGDIGGGSCAQVRLRIEQEAVITRDAFKATLEVLNNSDIPLQNVFMEVVARRADGQDASALFGIRAPVLENLTAVDGTGLISQQSNGRATWVIIPSQDAAPAEPVDYYISGTLRYVQDGLTVTVPLTGVSITVHPNPRLFVKYFHQRDVYSDDPFTDLIEPAEPFHLAVMIENRGKGDARNVRITSAQPEIVENEKGLLVDFQILATEVAGQNLTPSLTVNFGTITNGQIAIGRWLLTSTLQGLFTEYNATFEHLDELDNKRLSLIEDVTIHEMIRLIRAPGALDDGKPDFLVNDVPDAHDRPDTVYLSDGRTNSVAVVESATTDGPPSTAHLQVQLTAAVPTGWVYLRVPEPADGRFLLKNVVRSDGAEVCFNTNVWTTDRTFCGLGRRPVHENILHLVDYNSSGQYTLHYEALPAADIIAPTSTVVALPSRTPESFTVQWNGNDEGGEIAGFDIFVSANGGVFLPWLQRTKLTSANFMGEMGGTYAFYSMAADVAGNRETAPMAPDASTVISLTNYAPAIVPVADQMIEEGSEFALVPTVTDANLPDDQLHFALMAAPPGFSLNAQTGEMRCLTGEGNGPGTNFITWRVYDSGVPQRSATNTFTLVVREVNTAPVVASIPAMVAYEGRLLRITNYASDIDLPAQTITWSLGAGAPEGAAMDPNTGIFSWRPKEFQGGKTNAITIIARDNGPGELTTTQTLLVGVVDVLSDFVVAAGKTNVVPGESGYVSLYLLAGMPLTNVSFQLTVDGGRLTNLVLQPKAAVLNSATFEPVGTNGYLVNFGVAPGSWLQGSQELARLSFGTVSNSSSAAVRLAVTNVVGRSPAVAESTKGGGAPGCVFVVGEEPILDLATYANDSFAFMLYCQPGNVYSIELATNLLDGIWRSGFTVAPTNTWQWIEGVGVAGDRTFYRVARIESAGELSMERDGDSVILRWAVVRPNCRLEQASSLAVPSWIPVTDAIVTISNGIAQTRIPLGQHPRFYRLSCPR